MALIFLTGSQGQVGSEVELALLQAGHKVVSAPHRALNIMQEDHVLSAVLDSKADAVINAAAYANVEQAEEESTLAFGTNTLGPRNLALACAQADIPLIHLSTDYVFSDHKHAPHYEDDPTHAECIYGKSKLDGENLILASGCKHLIVRTSWLFGRFGRNFVKIMLTLAKERKELSIVCDQLGNPTPVRPLAAALVKMTEAALRPEFNDYGIYHYAGMEPTSWDEFARAIFAQAMEQKALNHEVKVRSISSNDFKSKAKRPVDSRLDCAKIEQVFGIKPPKWQEFLGEVITAYMRECQGLTPVDGYDNTTSLVESTQVTHTIITNATGPARLS